MFSIISSINSAVNNFIWGLPAMICIILFLGGIQLFCVGILGQYLSKTYLETKRRPICILKETEESGPRADQRLQSRKNQEER